MLIIKEKPEENGAHANQSGNIQTIPDGWLAVPPELEAEAQVYLPFIKLTIKNGIITAVAQGKIPPPDMAPLRAAKLAEISAAANAAIIAGCEVNLPSGTTEQFALTETDQINLSAAFTAIEQGAVGYPYHADGQLCRLYPAADIVAIGMAVTAHKLYHTTYCNHVLVWTRRAETAEELDSVYYGAYLPKDLAANMMEVLQFEQGN